MSASTPLVTVVVTTRDRRELADRALSTVLAQTMGDLEIVVVDDGSTEPYRIPVADARVKVLRHEQARGPSAARNAALAIASGRWITFLDDDDVWLPHMLETSLDQAGKSSLPAPVSILSGIEIVDPAGTVLKTRLPPTLVKGQHFFLEDLDQPGSFQTHATLVAPVDVVRQIGGFDEDLRGSEHDDFFLRLNAQSSIVGVSEITYRINAHTGPRLSKAVLERAEGMEKTVAKHKDTFRLHRRRYGRYMSTMGVTYLRAGRWGPAVSAMTRSIMIDPTRPRAYGWWLASLAGPEALELFKKIRPKDEQDS
ncbi:MAG TPA: glycosyltransferase family 2 protein [Acidimicrobiia bacterium]